MAGNKTPRAQRRQFKVTVNGKATSEDTRQVLGLPVNPDEPAHFVTKPAVKDTDFTDAYEANFLNPERVQKVQQTIDKGIDSTDEKVAVGTAISERGDMTRVYLQKTKDRKPQLSTTTLSPDQLLEHASNPLKWVQFMWPHLGFDRSLNDRQIEIITTSDNELVLMPRQVFGKTTAIALGKVAHSMIFKPGISILVATNVEDSAKRLIEIVTESVKKYGDLCGFLQVTKDNEKEFELGNGSRVKALSSGSSAPRGFTAQMLILDEAAYISDDRFYKELLPTTASITNPVIIASTTPNGKQGWFYKYWSEIHWSHISATRADCTWKTDEWFENKRKEMTDTAYRQEFECEFLDVENAVFSVEQIDNAIAEFDTWEL